MVKKIIVFFYFIILFIFSNISYSEVNTDQWIDSEKTYKDLVDNGFEVKGYSMNTIETDSGIKLILFVTVLQKNNDVYECQEYQTLDQNLETLDLSTVCRQLVQPYQRGVGT